MAYDGDAKMNTQQMYDRLCRHGNAKSADFIEETYPKQLKSTADIKKYLVGKFNWVEKDIKRIKKWHSGQCDIRVFENKKTQEKCTITSYDDSFVAYKGDRLDIASLNKAIQELSTVTHGEGYGSMHYNGKSDSFFLCFGDGGWDGFIDRTKYAIGDEWAPDNDSGFVYVCDIGKSLDLDNMTEEELEALEETWPDA